MIILSQKLSIKPPPGIEHELFRIQAQDTVSGSTSEWVLMLSFKGSFPIGEKGRSHGTYVSGVTMRALVEFQPFGLILDYRALEFSWGNFLLKVYEDVEKFMAAGREPRDPAFPDAPRHPFPVITLTSEKSRTGFVRLVAPYGHEPPKNHFDDFNAAVKAAAEAADLWAMD
jgi:hypothetical protein